MSQNYRVQLYVQNKSAFVIDQRSLVLSSQDQSSDEPPAKKARTEDDLIPENQFLKTNPVCTTALSESLMDVGGGGRGQQWSIVENEHLCADRGSTTEDD